MDYDNLGRALVSTFSLAAGGWAPLMWSAIDVVEEDHQPQLFASTAAALYFTFGIFFFGFYLSDMVNFVHAFTFRLPPHVTLQPTPPRLYLIVTLATVLPYQCLRSQFFWYSTFTQFHALTNSQPHLQTETNNRSLRSVVFGSYLNVKSLAHTGLLVSTDERRWLDFEAKLMKLQPMVYCEPPGGAWRARCSQLVNSPHFDHFITTTLVMNFVTLAMTLKDPSATVVTVQNSFNVIVTVVFLAEHCIKVFAEGIMSHLTLSHINSHPPHLLVQEPRLTCPTPS